MAIPSNDSHGMQRSGPPPLAVNGPSPEAGSDAGRAQGAGPHDADVLVIGGGPGGSTVSTLLARRGWRVTMLERDHHPRFHIGESLLPHNNVLLDELGVLDEIRRVAVIKPGAEFHSKYHGRAQTFNFSQAFDTSQPTAFQVHRADFDAILFRNAATNGVAALEGTRVTSVDFTAEGVTACSDGERGRETWRARFLVDASGRDAFLAGKLQLKAPNRRHNSAAIFAHYEGAHRWDGPAAGNISIYWFDHGWIWFIPLSRGITSVGAVCWPYYLKSRKGSLDAFLDETFATVPELAKRLVNARRTGPATATGNYSYESRRAFGDRYVLVGDAFAFVDPIFSSGVYLAMTGASEAATAVDAALREPARAASRLRALERRMREGLGYYKWFIYRMTSPTMRDLIMGPRNLFGVVEGLVGFLAGDVFRPNGVRRRVLTFKALYYAFNLFAPLRAWRAWMRRRASVQPSGE